MDKKTKMIVVVVLALVAVGGVYYSFNRWRQQRLVNQVLKEAYGVNTGLLGKLTGGGSVPEQVAREIANEAAKDALQQKTDEAKEAAKTPEDRYNEDKEMPTYDANSKAVAAEAKSIVEKAFGKAKLTSISTGLYGLGAGSGVMEFKISRLATGNDLAGINKALTDKGLPILQSGIDNKTASVMAGSSENTYTISFEIDGQTVGVSIIKNIE